MGDLEKPPHTQKQDPYDTTKDLDAVKRKYTAFLIILLKWWLVRTCHKYTKKRDYLICPA